MSNPYAHTHSPDEVCTVQCPQHADFPPPPPQHLVDEAQRLAGEIQKHATPRMHNRCGLGDPDICGHPDCPNEQPSPTPTPEVAAPVQGQPSDLICGVCGANVTDAPGTLCPSCGMSLSRAKRRVPVTSKTGEVPVQHEPDREAVSLTNPQGATSPEKMYPASQVMDLLERAYMEGAWIGGKGHANTPRTVESYNRWVIRLRERDEL